MWHFVELKEARDGQRTTDGQMTERPEKARFKATRATFGGERRKTAGAAEDAGESHQGATEGTHAESPEKGVKTALKQH